MKIVPALQQKDYDFSYFCKYRMYPLNQYFKQVIFCCVKLTYGDYIKHQTEANERLSIMKKLER